MMTTPPVQPNDPVSNAWQVHQALGSWTTNVDSKSTFVLGLQTGLLAGAVALRGSESFLQSFNNSWSAFLWSLSLVLLGSAVGLTAWVVSPHLNKRKLDKDSTGDYIFFGHLWRKYPSETQTPALIAAFQSQPVINVLARQLQIMAEIAWKKHRRLQLAMLVGTAGAFSLGVSIVVN